MKEKITEVKMGETLFLGVPVPPRPESVIPVVKPDVGRMKRPEDYMWQNIGSGLRRWLERQVIKSTGGSPVKLNIIPPPPNISADFGVVCHPLAGVLKRKPAEIALEMSVDFNKGRKPSLINRAEATGPYLNFQVDFERFSEQVFKEIETMGNHFGEQNIGKGKTVVFDTSSPNIAKHMAVGHLRSTVIGESLARIYRAAGFTTIRDNHLGDWGTQFGILGRAYELWEDEIPELGSATTAVEGLYKLYVRMHRAIEEEKGGDQDKESQLEKAGREWFARLEGGDPKAVALWKWARKLSLKEFQRVYDLLGSKFEYFLGESEYISMLPAVVKRLLEKGIAEKDSTGMVAVYFRDEGGGKLTPEKKGVSDRQIRIVVQKADGTSLYQTRDLATLVARTRLDKPEKIVYVVGGDQKLYFQQVFAIFNKWAGTLAPKIEHVYFGMITLPEGKMSTRAGRVIFLEDVLRESIKRAKEKILKSKRDLSDDEIEKVAGQVGVGAVIYFDLKQGRERDIQFKWEDALSFEGNSGPYLQYTYARSESILRRAVEGDKGESHFETDIEKQEILRLTKDMVKKLAMYPESIKRAMVENQPCIIAEHIFSIANLFNQWYKSTPVLGAPTTEEREARLRLTSATAQVIKNGLDLLGIEAPEKM